MSKELNEILKPIIGPNSNYIRTYFGKDKQLYHFIEWALKQTGKAEIIISTFSFGEEFIRKIWKLKKENLIENITVFIDFKAIEKTNKLLQFSQNVFDKIVYCPIHAKITLIKTEQHKITITGSQNATRGNRYESTIISTNVEMFNSFYENLNRLKK